MPADKYEEYQQLLAERDEREFRARVADGSSPAATLRTERDVRQFFDELGELPGSDTAASA
jgi:hypothetical protein